MATATHSAPTGAINTSAPTIPGIDSPPDTIAAAWARRRAAYAEYRALPIHASAGKLFTPDEARLWKVIDDAEAIIQANTATTLAEVAAQLWVALSHTVTEREYNLACDAGDLAAFPDSNMLDWNVRLLLSALRSLEALSAAGPAPNDDPVSRFWLAHDGYNADSIPEADFHAAWHAMTAWTPPSQRDFVRKVEALFAAGVATADDRALLMQQAAALLGGERCGREG